MILDDDTHSQAAVHHILDSEGWQVKIVSIVSQGMTALAAGNWTLAIVNVAMTGIDGPAFETLRDLTLAPAAEGGTRRTRVLFLVPELAAEAAVPHLERDRLPFVLKPVNLHDFLEKVSDLMLESEVIADPIRRVKREYAGKDRRGQERRSGEDRRDKGMFASSQDYFDLTDEELAEYEKQEAEAAQQRKLQREQESKDLGGSKGR